jgi:hypothetical protein
LPDEDRPRRHLLAVVDQITEDLSIGRVADDGSRRHLDIHVLAACSGLVRTAAVVTTTGPHLAAVMEVEEGVQPFIDDQNYVAATPSVTAVGSSSRYELLAPEGYAAVAAVARAHRDAY